MTSFLSQVIKYCLFLCNLNVSCSAIHCTRIRVLVEPGPFAGFENAQTPSGKAKRAFLHSLVCRSHDNGNSLGHHYLNVVGQHSILSGKLDSLMSLIHGLIILPGRRTECAGRLTTKNRLVWDGYESTQALIAP